jgi:hypothetical protein
MAVDGWKETGGSPVGLVQTGDLAQKVHMTGEELEFRAQLKPLRSLRIITTFQLKSANGVAVLIVKVARDRLHPRVVCFKYKGFDYF